MANFGGEVRLSATLAAALGAVSLSPLLACSGVGGIECVEEKAGDCDTESEGSAGSSSTNDASSTVGATTVGSASDSGSMTTLTTTTDAEPVCRNGVVEDGEECDGDDGDVICNADCTLAMCGDEKVSSDEECDGDAEGMACNDDCTLAECGDGQVSSDEGCDGDVEGMACNGDCTSALCGDGKVSSDEECDAGEENANGGECTSECKVAVCGDGKVWEGNEECDDAGDSMNCDADCTQVECGDGYVNAAAGEECDGMGELTNATCTIECVVACVNGAVGDCDGNPMNGCETDFANNDEHCGACDSPCMQGLTCSNVAICV
jgi:hypothetical protein